MPDNERNSVALPTFFKPLNEDVFDRLRPKSAEITTGNNEAQHEKRRRTMRFAGYVRISSEEQVGNFSVDAQVREIKAWVKAQGGVLVNMYIDEAKSGKTANRPQFQQMRTDARKRTFDAIVVHKF